MKRGLRPSGDLIPWTVSEQFQDDSFAQLNGIRIIRIATHPSAQNKGYGSRALELLMKYYEQELIDQDNVQTDEADELRPKKVSKQEEDKEVALISEKLKPKKHLKPILQKLSERKPIPIHYLGTSFGLTKELFNFWRKNHFVPLYLRQTANDLTGEHTCLMLRPINTSTVALPEQIQKYADEDDQDEESWARVYTVDFRKRLQNLLGFEFRHLPCALAL
jgi:N-acetyltransferase 10